MRGRWRGESNKPSKAVQGDKKGLGEREFRAIIESEILRRVFLCANTIFLRILRAALNSCLFQNTFILYYYTL